MVLAYVKCYQMLLGMGPVSTKEIWLKGQVKSIFNVYFDIFIHCNNLNQWINSIKLYI